MTDRVLEVSEERKEYSAQRELREGHCGWSSEKKGGISV